MGRALLAVTLAFGAALAALRDGQGTEAGAAPLDVSRIVAGLPWAFEITRVVPAVPGLPADLPKDGRVESFVYDFASTRPYGATPEGGVFLRARLKGVRLVDPEHAHRAFARILERAHPDMGLSYAWDYLMVRGDSVFHLHAGCVFSEARFQQMAEALEAITRPAGDTSSARFVRCRCGGGCREQGPP